jgi:ADP-heptose:LPS heptosyltransferase
MTLQKFDEILDLSLNHQIEFYSLQKGEGEADASKENRLANLMDEVTDFDDTAGIIANLDLVISVDTSVVHLAGALGKPVWVLSRKDACWRWLENREDSPWYPNARVYGQPNTGDWDSVMKRIKSDLEKLL